MGFQFTDADFYNFYTQRVLPTIFDDSLSYLEKLNKAWVAINDLIEQYNTFGNNLTTYVNENVEEFNADILQKMIVLRNDVTKALANESKKTLEEVKEEIAEFQTYITQKFTELSLPYIREFISGVTFDEINFRPYNGLSANVQEAGWTSGFYQPLMDAPLGSEPLWVLLTLNTGGEKIQIYFPIYCVSQNEIEGSNVYIRRGYYSGSSWVGSEWASVSRFPFVNSASIDPNECKSGIYLNSPLEVSWNANNLPLNASMDGILLCFINAPAGNYNDIPEYRQQIYIDTWNGNIYTRRKDRLTGGTMPSWSEWHLCNPTVYNYANKPLPANTELYESGWYNSILTTDFAMTFGSPALYYIANKYRNLPVNYHIYNNSGISSMDIYIFNNFLTEFNLVFHCDFVGGMWSTPKHISGWFPLAYQGVKVFPSSTSGQELINIMKDDVAFVSIVDKINTTITSLDEVFRTQDLVANSNAIVYESNGNSMLCVSVQTAQPVLYETTYRVNVSCMFS